MNFLFWQKISQPKIQRWLPLLLISLLLIPIAARAQEARANGAADVATIDAADFAPGEVILALKPQTSAATDSPVDAVIAAADGTLTVAGQRFPVLEPLDLRNAPNEITNEITNKITSAATVQGSASAVADSSPSGWLLQVEPGAELATVELLSRDPAVDFAEPNWIVRAADDLPQDEVPAAPVAEQRNGTVPPPEASLIAMMPLAVAETPFVVSDPFYVEEQWDMQRINASRAWQLLARVGGEAPTEAEAVRIAIVDSGIDAFHGDLYKRVLAGKNYLDPSKTPYDDYGHGTHVAGLAGATLNNGIGIAGVASNVLFDPRKVLDGNGAGRISNLAQAIREAADDGVNIINLSLETGEESQTLGRAVEYAAAQGVLLIAASGNGGRDVKWPAVHPDVMAVAALDYNDQRAYYSNYGAEIEIAAPGGTFTTQPIYSTWSRDAKYVNPATDPPREINKCDTGLREINGSSYCERTGTSMAAGIVSGVAAAVWAQQPDLTADEVRALLRDSAAPLDADAIYVGSGRIDMYAALRQVVPAELVLSSERLSYRLPATTQSFTATVELVNDSAQPLSWKATLAIDPLDEPTDETTEAIANPAAAERAMDKAWVEASGKLSGSIAYGKPARISLRVMPTQLLDSTTAMHSASLTITGTRADGTNITRETELIFTTSRPLVDVTTQLFLPLVNAGGAGQPPNNSPTEPVEASSGSIEYRWEEPGDAERIKYGLLDDSSAYVALPFSFEMRGRAYDSARLYSDGMLTFPSDDDVDGPPRCLPNVEWPRQAVYGWWADLNPGAAGARVSSFQPDEDRFVVEFLNVPDAANTYRVSFQIVLDRNGVITLSYGKLIGTSDPDALIARAPKTADGDDSHADVVVGVEAVDGRFHNLVGCASSALELGRLPRPYQSITFSPADIY